MSVIKIKRSGVAGSPSALAQGELAYSYLAGTEANGGDRLYIGTGVETAGEAANIEVIGGTYFTSKLDHTPGTLTASSALIVDSNSKIDVLNVDNITINGNAITSTDTNGNIQLSPNGSGSVDVATSKIINLVDPTSNQDAATKAYVDTQVGGVVSDFTIAADSGTPDTFSTGQTLTFAGDTGITTTVSDNQISIDLDDTAVTPGSYGSSTEIPTFTVDQQGRLTAAGIASIATGLSILGDSGTDTVQLLTGTLIFSGNTGITTIVGDDRVDIDLDDTAVTPSSYGDANTVATFTVDQQGRLTSAGTADIDHDALLNYVANEHIDHSGVSLTAGSGLTGGGDITASRSFAVGAGNGITVNANDVAVNAQDGLAANSSGTFVVAGDGLTANATGVHIVTSGDSSLVANSSGLFIDDSTLSVATSQLTGDIALGTQTSGSYVESLVEGTGVTITNNSGEGATPTIAIGQDVSSTANVSFQNGTFTGDLQIDGDFTVSGNVVTINVQELTVEDNMIYLNANSAQTNPDLGWVGSYDDGTYAHAGMFRDASDGIFKVFDGYVPEPDDSPFIDTSNATFALADMQAETFIGALQGNANTATTLETARTIQLSGDVTGSASFDGSADINITATIAADSIALGTDTTGDYVESVGVTAGTGLSVTGTGEGATVTLAGVNATTTTKGVASFSADNFTVTSGAVSIATLDGGTY
jgi:hypothetical protein